MSDQIQSSSSDHPSGIDRRVFLSASGGALAAAALGSTSLHALPAGFHNGVDDTIRVGLVGCGGRGTGAAVNALNVEPRAKLVAMGDIFGDRVDSSHKNLLDGDHADRIDVPEERRFSGWDAFEQVTDCCDVVILASTPHFRPQQIEKAIAAGKHIFAEKPIATDPVGVARVREACRQADAKGLTIVSGLCYRYQDAKQDTIARVHDGSIGDIVSLQCTYNTGGLWYRGRKDEWSEMEYQIRNWYYYTWLSGDHIAEQSIHSIDKMMWAMKDVPPVKCSASGGRICRTEEKWGDIYDHFNTVFEWEDGVKLFHSCRQWPGADGDVSDYVYGTRGTAAIQRHRIDGEVNWSFDGSANDMYDAEWVELFRSVKGERERINNGEYMCDSTLASILGRTCAYTGKTITWDEIKNSELNLAPAAYAFGPAPEVVVPRPGTTKFV
ncbi:MAG: Gfo/Idh/MocA family oxidoreductase [Planctomycetota bacterium]|nr:Gfo/Idh/MocA family oxidoreductase [Planctomycetota bacterium]